MSLLRAGFASWWLIISCLFHSACQTKASPPFNAQRAYDYLKKQCDFGPRTPGSSGHEQCKDFLVEEMKKYAEFVALQPFTQHIEGLDATFTFTNIIANFNVSAGERILLCAHWDTRPWADNDPDPRNHSKPVMGANDGASGVAVLLEVARLMKITPPSVGVDIILFDAEDCGSRGNSDSYSIGSQRFAKLKSPDYFPRFGILLDMVGDVDLRFPKEQNSLQYAPEVVNKVWERAADLGIDAFVPEVGYQMAMDDHLRLLAAGIPTIDIIDFDYPYWHTVGDTPDKCSPESLSKIGEVIVSIVYDPDL